MDVGGSEEASVHPLALSLPVEPLLRLELSLVATLQGHTDRVWCVAWCPTANILASCSGDKTVRLWTQTVNGWECATTLEGEHSGTVRYVSWSPSGEYIACASFDHTATVWRRSSADAVEFDIDGVLDGHESEVKCVEWATDNTLATCSRDHTVWVWDRIDEGEYECGGVLTGHTQDVKHCMWHIPMNGAGRPFLISCSYDNTVCVWCDSHRQDDWQCVQTLRGHEATVWDAAFQRLDVSMEAAQAAESGGAPLPQPLLCTCSDDLTIVFWKRGPDGRFISVARSSGTAERSLYSVDWAPHGAPIVACASGDNSISLLSLSEDSEGVHVHPIHIQRDAHNADVNSVSFSYVGSLSEGVFLASGGDDGVVRIWRAAAR